MALTLAQAAAVSSNQLAAGVMETLVPNSPFLARLNFDTIEGNAYQYNSEATLSGAEFRAVNAGYAESTGTYTSATESLVILGGDADVDRFIQQTRSNLIDQMQTQVRMKAKAVAYKFNDALVNGDTAVDANSFNGLKKRLTGSQVIAAGTNGIPIVGNGGTDIQAFFDQLDNLLSLCPSAELLVANASVLSRFRSASRRLTSGAIGFDNGALGQVTMTYNGIPIVDAGKKVDGTPIIPQTETQGTATGTTSSIYAVSFGSGLNDPGVVGLTNGGVQVDPPRQLETKPAWRSRIEWYCGVALFGTQPAARLTGVLAA
jgi:hypothetical protein